MKHKALTLEQAVERITCGVTPLGTEEVAPGEAGTRPLAADVRSPIDQPPFPRSPLDGYAFRGEDSAGASPEQPVRLKVVGKHYAGDPGTTKVGPGEAVRLFTGAVIPQGANCVIRQEDTDSGEDTVTLYRAQNPWDNYCYAGEDFKRGDLLLPAGTVLDYAALGLLAGAGVNSVSVYRYPEVAVLSTGDELVQPGQFPLPPGKIYSSNTTLITARLSEFHVPNSGWHVSDDPNLVAERVGELLGHHDLVITTGGVSVGQKDFMAQAVSLLGAETVFHGVMLKPGSPALFARWEGKYILALSGNPFAAATTVELLARPLLAALSGDESLLPRRTRAVLDTPFGKASKGRRFIRGRLENGHVTLPAGHASGMLASLVGCNCLIDIPGGSGPLSPGQDVDVVLL